jgi:hypothetical protein
MLRLSMVVSVALCGAPKVDARLVGAWLAGTAPWVTLNADGSGSMGDGKIRWQAARTRLTVIDDEGIADVVTYRLEGDTLTLRLGETSVALTRAPGLAQLLTSSAWCTGPTRMQFSSDGSWAAGPATGGRWEIANDQLSMSTPQLPQLTRVPGFRVARDASGHPIIHSMGRVYARCD